MTLQSCRRHLIAALASLWLAVPAHAIEEAELKAAIIFNILMFVDWPAEAKPEVGGPLGFCVIGADAGLHAALKALHDRPIRGYRFEVRDAVPPDAPKACHAAFIDSSERQRKAASMKALRTSGVLVFSDDVEVDAAAVVLQRAGNKIAFDVNLQAVRQARLQVSSKLLRLARVVRE